jgi:hypothetical protein
MTSAFITQVVLLALLALGASQLTQQKREVDSAGNPTLRFWGTCLLGLMSGFFFLWIVLKNLGDPFHQRHPENTAVEEFFCVFGFVVAAWGYCYKITLTNAAIILRYLPFLTRVYPLDSVDKVEPMAKGSARILLSNGRKITVVPFFSGRPHFLESLGKLLNRRGAL